MTAWQRLRDSFIAGLILVAPLVITLYVLQVLSGIAFEFIDPVVRETNLESYTANVELAARAIAAVLILILVTLLGFIAQRRVGQQLFGGLGRTITLVPIVRTIYSTVRQISTSVSSKESSYDSLVLVEYPRRGAYAIGLVTSESPQAVSDVEGSTVHNVFLPSSPNPASGRLLLVPEEQLYEVDLSVRQGMGLLMTTGAGTKQAGESAPSAVEMSPEEAIASLEELEEDS